MNYHLKTYKYCTKNVIPGFDFLIIAKGGHFLCWCISIRSKDSLCSRRFLCCKDRRIAKNGARRRCRWWNATSP